ncbi:hypothetical protein BDV27DRAFT_158673 [Aspergillus caelatus]|uniref:Amine oxidase n=1 Tax=Aspergillus caelatus TaxID=61420 RepID=A0A5N7A4Y9_9EURO|nr:uncharacterized protein BDV27DRAFT_158673 [Aspergillus caelatus]KAE8363580.1 hypothetical protein BDV27DRAFT_158673 [Aspergillus caelatus]
MRTTPTRHETYDVVVVGAGLSGLQAAQIVQGAGFKVCVVEAIDRVGGKTLTAKSCEKGFNDLGASWINDTNQSEMFKLYQRYGIDTEVQRDRGHTLIQSAEGSLVKVPYGELPGDPNAFLDLLQVFRDECSRLDLDGPTSSARAREIDQLTFRDFCIEKIQSESAVTIADVLSVSLLGVESYEVSALFMLLYFKSDAGIDNIISDQKNGGQKPNDRSEDGRRTGSRRDKGRQWSKMPRASRHQQAWEQFSQAFGQYVDVPQPVNILEMEWTKEAYFLGAPCPITTPGTLSIVGKEIAAPFGHVHFVGTETSRVWRGYMEGAIQSGQRGGAEVVKAFSTNPTSRL